MPGTEQLLLVRMEASLAKFEKQMARGHKSAARTSRGVERMFDRTNRKVAQSSAAAAKSFGGFLQMSGRGRFVVQNTSNQLGDMAVQLQMGTSAARVMGQQLPQLFGGFAALGGTLGVVAPLLGTVAAIGIPIGAAMFALSRNSEDAAAALSELGALTLDGARSAVADLTSLQNKYVEALKVAAQTRSQTSIDNVNAIGMEYEAQKALLDLQRIQTETRVAQLKNTLSDLKSELSGILDEARREAESTVLPVIGDPDGMRRRNEEVAKAILKAVDNNEELRRSIRQAEAELKLTTLAANATADGLASAADFSAILERADLITPINLAANAASVLAGNLAAAVTQLQRIAAASSAALAASRQQLEVANARQSYGSDSVGLAGQTAVINARYELDDGGYGLIMQGRAGELADLENFVRSRGEAAAQLKDQTDAINDALKPPKGGGGGGGGSGGGSRGGGEGFFSSVDREVAALERQVEMIGKTKGEIAELTAKYRLLDEAKKRNLDLDVRQTASGQTLRQEIDAQAAAIGQLTAEAEQYAERAKMMDDLNRDLQNGFIDAILEGKNFAGVLADIAKQLARALLQAALFGSGPFGGGGGLLSGLFGSLFGSAKGNAFQNGVPVTAYANGGVVNGPTVFPMAGARTGLMGEAGPEAIMPLTRTADGRLGVKASGGSGAVTVVYSPNIDARGADVAAVAKIQQQMARDRSEFPAMVLGTVRKAQKSRHL